MLSTQQVRRAAACAVRAPSLHNTQPWLFTQVGDTVHVRADRERWLKHEDPLGRELLMSCGGSLRHLVLGLRCESLELRTDLLPDPEDPDLVAVVTVVGDLPPTLVEMELREAARVRHTDRSAFAPEPVSPGILDRLRRIVEAEGCVLDVLDEDDILQLSVLTGRADRILGGDAALSTEQDGWTSALENPTEGVPAQALPDHGRQRGSSVPLRDFHSAAEPPPTNRSTQEPPPAEHPTLLVLGSMTDDWRAWISAGWTLTDVLLTLTSLGLVSSPISQPLEIPALRTRLQTALGMQSHPQLVLRVGHPSGSGSPATGRRPVSEVLC